MLCYVMLQKNQEIQILLTTLRIESLDAARRATWEESSARMNFSHSSRYGLFSTVSVLPAPSSIRQTTSLSKQSGIPSRPGRQTSSNGWHQARQNSATDPHPQAISPGEVVSDFGRMKLGTAPGYDLVHPRFLKHLGPKELTWLADLCITMSWEQRISKIWRQAKIVALAKPGKDPHLAASRRPISLLSVCYKLLERTMLQRISPTVEDLLSVNRAGFRRGRSTCDQVTALTAFIENGFEKTMKTGAVFLVLTAAISAYDTI